MDKRRAFLSYNWRDRRAVEDIARALKERGIDVFLDRWYLVAGRPWVEELESALAQCRATAVFVGPNGMGRWQQREKELALDRHAKDSSFGVIPVLLPGAEDPALGFLSLHTWVDFRDGITTEGLELLASAIEGRAPGLPPPALQAAVCPYRGLTHFREEDEPFFFGRESFTGKLVEAVDQNSFVAVLGASGSGKSSVVRAGLVPALRHRIKERVWDIVTMVPQDLPFRNLAACFFPLLEPEMSEVSRLAEIKKLGDYLHDGSLDLRSIVDRALEKQPGTDRLLLVVDQWEELYTLCKDEAMRTRFIGELLEASSNGRLSVVLTLRGDFYGHAVSDRALADRLQDGIVNIGPMTRDELCQAIVKPAERVGLHFEDGLAQRILDDVGEEPGNLPLLEFLLTELWERRRGSELFHEAYDAIGGVRGAIAERAEAAFGRLRPEEQKAVHSALLHLVHPGDGTVDTRRRALLDELGPAARGVVEMLARERLLVTGRDVSGQEVVEVGHEALIREWKRLRNWVDEDRAYLRALSRLEDEAAAWREKGRTPELLLPRGRLLAEAEELLHKREETVGPQLREYIEASVRARDRIEQEELKLARLRARWAWAAASVLLALLAVAVASLVYADRQAQFAIEQQRHAEARASTALRSAASLVAEVQRNLGSGGISAAVASRLLEAAEATLGDLAKAAPTREIQQQQVELLLSSSDVLSALGKSLDALNRANAARDLAEALAAQDGDEPKRRRGLLASHMKVGDAQKARGNLAEAVQEYRTTLAIAGRFATQSPDELEWRHELSVGHAKLAGALRDRGDLNGALDEYSAALALAEQLVSRKPDEFEWLRAVSSAHNGIGDIRKTRGDLDGALESYRATIAAAERLVEPARSDAKWQRNISLAHYGVGDVSRIRGDLAGTLSEYLRALDIAKQLAHQDPNNAEWQHEFSVSHTKVGEILSDSADYSQALQEYRAALDIVEQLAKKDPSSPLWRHQIAVSHGKLGDTWRSIQDLPNARDEYRQALDIVAQLARDDQSNAKWQQDLLVYRSKLGDVFEQEGNPVRAAEEYGQALAIAKQLAARDRSNAEWQHALSVGHDKLGAALRARGDRDGALDQYLSALGIAERLADQDRSNAERRRELLLKYDKVGDLLRTRNRPGDPGRAVKYYGQALEIRVKAAQNDSSGVLWRRDIVAAWNRIGDALEAQGALDGALDAYGHALEAAERLAKEDGSIDGRRRDVLIACDNVGRILAAKGDLEGALQAYRKAIAGSTQGAERAPASAPPQGADVRQTLEDLKSRVAELKTRMDGHADAGWPEIPSGPSRPMTIVPGVELSPAVAPYSTLEKVDLKFCRNACARDAQCRAFTYNTRQNRCLLKPAFADSKFAKQTISGSVNVSRRERYNEDPVGGPIGVPDEPAPNRFAGLVPVHDTDLPGNDYSNQKNVTLEHCRDLCAGDRKCRAFTYSSVPKLCWLKTGIAATVRNVLAQSGIKN